MEFNINKVIKNLSNSNYPLFVSEKHFQTVFIIEASKIYPKYNYYPEYVYSEDGINYHIDLLVCNGDKESIAFEFKYVVAGGVIKVPGDDKYQLRNHSAIDIRRHQCVRDISRLERYVFSPKLKCKSGYFLLITNMHSFWDGSKKTGVAVEFDIKDKTILKKGIHRPTGKGRFSEDYEKILIKNNHSINYKDYVKLDMKNGLFKILCIKV